MPGHMRRELGDLKEHKVALKYDEVECRDRLVKVG